ncbi:hypothetical protein D557_0289 [Bordetella holmesii 70147]|nr:hypothetical protein D557_0289 [Bordetella holmesii 70147]
MAGRAVIAIAFDLAKRDVDTECAEVMQSFDAGPCRLADQALGDRCAIDNVAWRRRQCGPGEGEDEQTTEESGGLAHRGRCRVRRALYAIPASMATNCCGRPASHC